MIRKTVEQRGTPDAPCDFTTESMRTLPRRPLRVLIVDDEGRSAAAMATKVEPWGRATFASFDNVLSRKAVRSRPPDVVLLNLTAPTPFRLDVASRLQRDLRRRDCLFIAVAGWISELLREQCTVAGVDLFFAASLDESIVDALLQLESIRLNRSPGESRASDLAESPAPTTLSERSAGLPRTAQRRQRLVVWRWEN